MLNTCSIGRRWKSREGWSRPVLTGERGTLFPPLAGRVSSCGGFLVGWQGTLFLVVTTIGKAFDLLASVVRFPDRHDRNRGWFRCRPIRVVGRSEWFCGGHGPGETPGPFPNPEAKAWHGDGTALERVWESSTPPHSTVWTFWSSPLRDSRKVPFLFAQGVFLRPVGDYGRRQAGLREDSSSGWRFSDCGRPVGVLVIPVSGGIWTVRGLAAGGFLQ